MISLLVSDFRKSVWSVPSISVAVLDYILLSTLLLCIHIVYRTTYRVTRIEAKGGLVHTYENVTLEYIFEKPLELYFFIASKYQYLLRWWVGAGLWAFRKKMCGRYFQVCSRAQKRFIKCKPCRLYPSESWLDSKYG